MLYFINKQRNRIIVFYLIFVYAIVMTIESDEYQCRTIQCYKCSGGEECGIHFSPNSNNNIEYISKHGNELFYSCSISVNPNGITTRDLVLSNTCRSSTFEYCCKDNLCNFLPSPPLPAFTNLMCIVGNCSFSSDICHDGYHIAYRSSPAESCSLTMTPHTNYVCKSYRKSCLPRIIDIPGDTIESSLTIQSDCCNSLECNLKSLNGRMVIGCYVCDSRIMGLIGCSILNKTRLQDYKSGSSSYSEECATIIGLAGKDAISNKTYPDFIIRTIISNCSNQSFGNISYGGATFQGRINCCRTNYCNTEPFDIDFNPEIVTTITTTTKKMTTTTLTKKTTAIIERTTKTNIRWIIILPILVIISVFIIVITKIARRFNCRNIQIRGHWDSLEQIPIASPVDPSTLPFIQIITEP